MSLIDILTNFLFPQRCVLCNTAQEALCMKCLAQLPSASNAANSPARSALHYQNKKTKTILKEFKFHGRTSLARPLSTLLNDLILEEMGERMQLNNAHTFLLIPIPLSHTRHKKRGYNQSELLCRELLAHHTNLQLHTSILRKTKDTKPQSSLHNKEARKKNVAGCFQVSSNKTLIGRDVMLIDDITTTGATLEEASKVLKKAGARSVSCLTIAH